LVLAFGRQLEPGQLSGLALYVNFLGVLAGAETELNFQLGTFL
jgi:hypothetical protein